VVSCLFSIAYWRFLYVKEYAHRFESMNRYFLILSSLVLSASLSAQTYNFSGGIRLGTEYGFTLKYRVADKLTLEGIVQSPIREKLAITSLLLEKHNSIVTKGLNIYYGAGIQKGWVLTEEKPYEDPFGIVGIIGAEFNIARLNLSYDIKPAVNLVGGSAPVSLQTGLSIRYIFDKRQIILNDPKKKAKKKKKKLKEKEKRKRYKQRMKDKYGEKNKPKS